MSAGVPVTPGSSGVLASPDEVREAAKAVGYPILLKLDRGGGGKGIEKVESPDEVDEVFERVQRIGTMAFGNSGVYLEKAIPDPRHIEIQFLADRAGSVVCLGERECSIQRRHQKIIEESPSPIVTPSQRSQLTQFATRLAMGMGYVGAGTMEFLHSGTGDFYFMEVNARLQVEYCCATVSTDIALRNARWEHQPNSASLLGWISDEHCPPRGRTDEQLW